MGLGWQKGGRRGGKNSDRRPRQRNGITTTMKNHPRQFRLEHSSLIAGDDPIEKGPHVTLESDGTPALQDSQGLTDHLATGIVP